MFLRVCMYEGARICVHVFMCVCVCVCVWVCMCMCVLACVFLRTRKHTCPLSTSVKNI